MILKRKLTNEQDMNISIKLFDSQNKNWKSLIIFINIAPLLAKYCSNSSCLILFSQFEGFPDFIINSILVFKSFNIFVQYVPIFLLYSVTLYVLFVIVSNFKIIPHKAMNLS